MGAAEIKAARKQPGGSNVGKKTFASGKPRTGPYAGSSGGAPKGSYPIPDKAHAKAAIKMSGHAPNPAGIKSAVYRKYPNLKPEDKKQDGSKNTKSFPDLNKDGKVSRADVLVGRGVIPAKKMQMGTKSTKATKDSTKFFKNDFFDKRKDQLEAEKKGYSENYETNKRTFQKGESARKAGEDLKRQANKGKPGFDRNGFPLDKKMCGSKGMKYAEGTKSIKFKKKPMMKRADGSTSQRGLWDNIRANKGSGKKPTPEMLKQEKKIKFGK
jgi:hypothetical protein